MHHGHVTARATLARMAGVTDCTRVYHGAPVLRPQSNVCNIAGIARAPLVRREETAPAELYAATFVSLLPVRGGVLDAPRSDYCRAALDAPVRRGLLYPRFPRCARFASTTQRIQSRGRSPRSFDTAGRCAAAPASSAHPGHPRANQTPGLFESRGLA